MNIDQGLGALPYRTDHRKLSQRRAGLPPTKEEEEDLEPEGQEGLRQETGNRSVPPRSEENLWRRDDAIRRHIGKT